MGGIERFAVKNRKKLLISTNNKEKRIEKRKKKVPLFIKKYTNPEKIIREIRSKNKIK